MWQTVQRKEGKTLMAASRLFLFENIMFYQLALFTFHLPSLWFGISSGPTNDKAGKLVRWTRRYGEGRTKRVFENSCFPRQRSDLRPRLPFDGRDGPVPYPSINIARSTDSKLLFPLMTFRPCFVPGSSLEKAVAIPMKRSACKGGQCPLCFAICEWHQRMLRHIYLSSRMKSRSLNNAFNS